MSPVTFPPGLQTLTVRSMCGNIVAPTTLPATLRKLQITARDERSRVALSDWHLPGDLKELDIECVSLEPCDLPPGLRDFRIEVGCDSVLPTIPDSLVNLKVCLLETGLRSSSIDIQSLGLPDTLASLDISANNISFSDVAWPRALESLTAACDQWSIPLPDTLLDFNYSPFGDIEPIAIPPGFAFPDSVSSIVLYCDGDFTGGEPVWPAGLKTLKIYALSDMFTITSLPPHLRELYLYGDGVRFDEACVFPDGLVVGVPVDDLVSDFRQACNVPDHVAVYNMDF